QQRQEETEKENLLDQLSSNGLARRHAEYERHADGTYTSDISSYLEEQAAKEFIAWLMSGRGRRDLSEGTAKAVNIARRYSEGTYNSELHEILDEIATQEFLNWLLEAKVTERRKALCGLKCNKLLAEGLGEWRCGGGVLPPSWSPSRVRGGSRPLTHLEVWRSVGRGARRSLLGVAASRRWDRRPPRGRTIDRAGPRPLTEAE
ncbi:PREDICTED: glucagon-like, partial [Gekko japonicus]|uniref:Glucagon-like n=1 Tax=Gekko japonicus TaxID=146911 RepID=A0ABM1L8J5_GEKJA